MKSAASTAPLPFDVRLMGFTSRLLAALAVVGIVSAALAWAAGRPAFDLRLVQVEGDVTHNDATTLRASVLPHLAGNFFTINLQAARAAFEAAPWVRSAVVRRVWPMGIRVTLTEHRPVAYWGDDGEGSRLLNNYGEVFEANTGDLESDDLPVFRGPADNDAAGLQMLQMYRTLAPVFAPLGRHIKTLALSSQGGWTAELDDGARVEIGRGKPQEVVARTQRFADTIRAAMVPYGRRRLIAADLRHPSGYAMQLEGVTTAEPKAPTPIVGQRRY